MKDTFNTIEKPSKESLYKEKNSKFFGYAFPVSNEEEVKDKLSELKRIHPNAGHHCYAYQIGVALVKYRANDDGEPNNSAGLPIYGQIQSFDLTNVLIVIVRYFGGTKLGVSGLISAYKISAQMAIESSEIVERTIQVYFQLNFGYDLMSKVMRIIKEKNIEIIHQNLTETCQYKIAVRKGEGAAIYEIFDNLYQVKIRKLESHFL